MEYKTLYRRTFPISAKTHLWNTAFDFLASCHQLCLFAEDRDAEKNGLFWIQSRSNVQHVDRNVILMPQCRG